MQFSSLFYVDVFLWCYATIVEKGDSFETIKLHKLHSSFFIYLALCLGLEGGYCQGSPGGTETDLETKVGRKTPPQIAEAIANLAGGWEVLLLACVLPILNNNPKSRSH